MAASNKKNIFTSVQCKMARAGLGLGIRDLADLAECAPATIVRFEAGQNLHKRTIKAIRETLEEAGASFFINKKGHDAVAVQHRANALPVLCAKNNAELQSGEDSTSK